MAHSLFDIAILEPYTGRDCVFLTPNLRLARRIRHEWNVQRAAAGATVWEPLQAHPVDHWLLSQWERAQRLGLLPPVQLLAPQQELLLWQQVIAGHAQRGGGPGLLRPAGAAQAAREARDLLLRFRLDPSDPRVRQLFELEFDCATFLQWLALFDAQLAARELCSEADAVAALAEVAHSLDAPPAVLVGGHDLSPLAAACLRELCAELHTSPAGDPAPCAVHPYPDPRAELRAVAAWAAQQQRRDPEATVGIVLAGPELRRVGLEYFLRREFDCLGDDYNSLPVNFSAGISLAQAPVVRDALGVLSLLLERISVAAVVALLRSRFLVLPDAGSPLEAHFVTGLYAAGSESVRIGALRNFAASVRLGDEEGLTLGTYLLAMRPEPAQQRPALPSVWMERFNAVLDLWGWPGNASLDSLEFQQVQRWHTTQDDYRALDSVSTPLDCAGALALLRECCERQVSHPQTADSPVQVLGPLEAVGLAFDHLWVCGMQAASWPSPPAPNPLIPLSLQAAQHMPHATPQREWEFSANLLCQYRESCASVHASYSRQVDGVPDLPSALLADFEEQPLPAPDAVHPSWAEAQAAAPLETVDDSRGPELLDSESAGLRGGAAIIEDQSRCPFRAFARRRLKVEALPDFVQGLSAIERGHIVHRALEQLWQDVGDHATLLAMTAAERGAVIVNAATAGMARLDTHRRIAVGETCVDLERQRLEALLARWLELEAERGAFVVEATEQRVELSLASLAISLRVDRVDRLADGARVIIDYKTGATAVTDWLGERPFAPQLLLYGLATESPPSALAFAQVRPVDAAFAGLGEVGGIPGVHNDIARAVKGRMEADNWSELNTAWCAVIRRLADAFVNGEAAVDPLSRSCTYCGLQPLCRVDLAAAGSTPDDEPDAVEAGE